MRAVLRTFALMVTLALGLWPAQAGAQEVKKPGPWGRVSFIADGQTASMQGASLPGFTEMVTSVTFGSPLQSTTGTEYKLDFRSAAYPGTADRDALTSIYDAYIGQRMAGGALDLRFGQMWLNDLGGLGALGGFLAEVRLPHVYRFRQVRIGAFGGLEPQPMQLSYADNVRKGGVYVAFDGNGAWRDVLGFVTVRDASLTERNVITMTNIMPFTKDLMVYQAAEIDLTGPGGHGSGGLTYFFVNGNYRPTPRLELQGTFHRGWSIDARTITQDLLRGVPVTDQALAGMLYQSLGGRVTVTVAKNVRVFAGASRDRSNIAGFASDRYTFGAFASNLFKTGLDVRVSDDRVVGTMTSYNGWDVSVGRSIANKLYLNGEYSSSLSIVQVTALGGFNIQSRPRTHRFALTGNVYLTRRIMLLLSAEELHDDTVNEFRWISGISFNF